MKFALEYQSTTAERIGPLARAADAFMDGTAEVVETYGGQFIGQNVADNGYTIEAADRSTADDVAAGLSAVVGYPVSVEPVRQS